MGQICGRDTAGTYERSWGIEISSQWQEVYYADSGASFHGDGEWYSIYENVSEVSIAELQIPFIKGKNEGGRKLFDFSLLSGGRLLVSGTGNYLRFFISAALSQAAAKQTFDEASTHQHNLYTSQCLGNHQIFCFVKKKHLTPTPFLEVNFQIYLNDAVNASERGKHGEAFGADTAI